MANFIKKLFGTKSDRDLKELNPILHDVQDVYPEIEQLSNDQLRAKTFEFKSKIKDAVKDKEDRITEIKEQISANYDMDIADK